MIQMTFNPIKITQLSKDFNLKSKDVTDTFKDLGIDKKSGGSVNEEEFELDDGDDDDFDIRTMEDDE